MRATATSADSGLQGQEGQGWVSVEDLDQLSTRLDILYKIRLNTRTPPEYQHAEILKFLAHMGIGVSAASLRRRPPELFANLAAAGREVTDRPARLRTALRELLEVDVPELTPKLTEMLADATRPCPPRPYHYKEVARALARMGVSVSPTHLKSLRTETGINPSATLLNGLATFFDIPIAMLQTPMNESERQRIRAFFLDLLQRSRTRCLGTLVAQRLNYLISHARDNDGQPYNYGTIAEQVTAASGISIAVRDIQVLHEGRNPNKVNNEHLRGLALFFLVPPSYFHMEDDSQVRLINQQLELVTAARVARARGESPVFLRALIEAVMDPATAAEMQRKMDEARRSSTKLNDTGDA
jgi:hypothetical protein